jgi:hypothetical protein
MSLLVRPCATPGQGHVVARWRRPCGCFLGHRVRDGIEKIFACPVVGRPLEGAFA